MIDQMKIGVSLTLQGDATTKMEAFQKLVAKAASATSRLEKSLKSTETVLATFTARLEKLNPILKNFLATLIESGTAVKSLNTGLRSASLSTSGLGRSVASTSTKMANATRSVQLLKDELMGLAAAGSAAGVISDIIQPKKGNGGGKRKKGGIHVHPLSFMGLGFSGGAMAAGGAAYLGYKGFEDNKLYQNNLLQFSLQNLPNGTSSTADAFISSQHMPGVSKIALSQALVDAAVITKDTGAAMKIAPLLAQIKYLNNSLYGGSSYAFSNAQEQAAIKTAEMASGSKDYGRLSESLNDMFKVGTATGQRVTPLNYLAMMRAARGGLSGNPQALNAVDPNFLYYTMESAIQELGGPQGGRMFAQFLNHVVAGRMTTASAMDFQKLGLVAPGQAEYNKIGMIKRIKPGGIKNSDEAQYNMFQWLQDTYLPALHSHGITKWSDIRKHLAVDFTNTDLGLVTFFLAQMQKIQTNVAANKASAGIAQTAAAVSKSPAGQAGTISAAWQDLGLAFGKLTAGPAKAIMSDTLWTLNALTGIINFIDKAASAIQTVEKKILPDPEWGDKLIAKMFGFGSGSSTSTAGTANAPTSGNPGSTLTHTTVVQLNSDVIAKAVTKHQIKQGNRQQQASISRFNSSISPTPASTSSLG